MRHQLNSIFLTTKTVDLPALQEFSDGASFHCPLVDYSLEDPPHNLVTRSEVQEVTSADVAPTIPDDADVAIPTASPPISDGALDDVRLGFPSPPLSDGVSDGLVLSFQELAQTGVRKLTNIPLETTGAAMFLLSYLSCVNYLVANGQSCDFPPECAPAPVRHKFKYVTLLDVAPSLSWPTSSVDNNPLLSPSCITSDSLPTDFAPDGDPDIGAILPEITWLLPEITWFKVSLSTLVTLAQRQRLNSGMTPMYLYWSMSPRAT